jgi:tRNA(fMet)-specific endonuclease VapC
VNLKYVFDTNVFVQILRGKGHGRTIIKKLEATPPHTVAFSSVTLGELAFGADLATRGNEELRVLKLLQDYIELPFAIDVAWTYGKIRADLHKKGLLIGQLDMMIAATALHHQLILVTHNTHEFSRVKGLRIEDWQI